MRITKAAWLGLCLCLAPLVSVPARADEPATRLIARAGHNTAFHIFPAHPAPGQDVAHGPVIVLDAGGGLDAYYWDALVPELARRTGARIISYDRAGSGASDEVPGPWSVQGATEDLENGLRALGATHGVILVSHSLAGEIATYLAGRHPDWIAGAVLVDANVPDFFTDDVIDRQMASYAPMIAALKAQSPTPQGRQLLALADSFAETSRAFHKAVWPAAVPAVVIVSEKTPFDAPADAQWWRDAHARFAGGAPNRQLVSAQGSSHDVVHDRPEVIVQAVVDMMARKR
ncbi:alpha/beta fold hydrolase [Nitrospirillum iridis]|uniref:Pimeloyl-ACP methyl ester carboxylesterase n=1 Tax=Nitrospirillum iridis TaxID=765888 RepID=A0A7X0AXX0_9PROT|nr:alpha/beta fold hydrolase [Nitrospirillum iridis]MBB6252139.1 pimeloyl-ACP methyl ester carboxylesterase [Nitrospirillum iridis]